MTLLRQVSVNQVEDSEAPASISTRISFSIPRMESANLKGMTSLYKNTEAKYNTYKILIRKHIWTKSIQGYLSE